MQPGACLLACIRMVLAFLGQEVSEAHLASFLQSPEFGTPSFYINRLVKWDYRVTYDSGNIAQLRRHLDAGNPCILFVYTGWLSCWDENLAHAIVVVGAGGKSFYCHDPAFDEGPTTIVEDELVLAWSEFDYRYAMIERPEPGLL
jgi:ABC-type bacteriocin/lantibiotic exporter with double-glycine peptidase domain